jgi:hypothetical protein
MVLEELRSKINITELTTGDPTEGPDFLPYDIERELTPARQESMIQRVKEIRLKTHILSLPYFHAAINTKLLLPHRADELGLDEEIWEIIKEAAEDSISEESMPNHSPQGGPHIFHLTNLLWAKILFPEKYSEFGIDKVKEDEMIPKIIESLDEVNNLMSTQSPIQRWANYTYHAYSATVLFPHRANEFKFSEFIRQGWVTSIMENRGGGDWREFARELAMLKLVFPQTAREVPITASNWKNMAALLKGSNWDPEKSLPVFLKMLTAEKIVPSDNGVDIIMPYRATNSVVEPMPEERRF